MKNKLLFFYLFFELGILTVLQAQNVVEVGGTVRSPQGVVQDAQVDFLDTNDSFMSNSTTAANGTFKSAINIQVGKSIKIRVSKFGFENLVKEVRVERTGDAGVFMLRAKKLIISGLIKDSVTRQGLAAAKISFLDTTGKPMATKTSNSTGYFEFETDFIYGQKITIQESKKDYYDKEQTLTFASDGINKLQDILLSDVASRGLKVSIQIKDKKTDKLLGGGTVRYTDKKDSANVAVLFSATSKLELKIYQSPGSALDLEISKPNYKTLKTQQVLSADGSPNSYVFPLEKNHRSSLGPILLAGGGAMAVLSGVMYLSSTKKYDSYKDYGNLAREKDFNSAQSSRTISAVAGGVAAAALVTYIITKISEKKKLKALEKKQLNATAFHFSPVYSPGAGNVDIISFAYHF